MKRVFILASIGLLLLALAGCKITEEVDNPLPALTSISPVSKVAHLPTFTLSVHGSDFVSSSRIVFDGTEKATSYVSDSELTCLIEPDDILINSSAAASRTASASNRNVTVLVRSPSPGGGDSNSLNFAIYGNHTFNNPSAIHGNAGTSARPAIAVDGEGNLDVIYEFFPDGASYGAVSFVRSDDRGDSWETPRDIVQFPGLYFYPCLAADSSGGIYAAFNIADTVYFSQSSDQGDTWSYPAAVSTPSNAPLVPAVALDGEDGVNIAWPQYAASYYYYTYFSRSVDQGVNWTAPVNVFNNFDYASSVYEPRIAADQDGGVYVSWGLWPIGGSRYGFLFFNYSHDYGSTWNTADTNFGIGMSSDIAVDPQGNVNMVVDRAYIPFMYQIVFHKSMDRGVSWNEPVDITSGGFDSTPHMAIDSAGNINVVYYSNDSYLFTRSIDGGATWSPGFQVLQQGDNVDIAVDPYGDVFLVWDDRYAGQVYFTGSVAPN